MKLYGLEPNMTTRVKTKIKNIDYVYVGHTIVRQPLVLGNVFYIDTGAFCNEEFTIVNLTDIHAG